MMRIKKRNFILLMAAAFVVGGALTMGAYMGISHGILGNRTVSAKEYTEMAQTYERYGKLNQIYDTISSSYYEDFDGEALIDGACKGLVAGLKDPYSEYMTADEYKSWAIAATGNYSGVGVTFTRDDEGRYTVIAVEKDSPADKGGIKAGDIILKVDDKEYNEMNALANAIRGDAGSRVKLTYGRDGSEHSVTMTREDIVQHSVDSSMLDGDIGYISINSFIESTYDDFKAALEKTEKAGAKGLILDLRDNGGGLVNSCVSIADEFLDEGPIVYLESRKGEKAGYNSKDGKTDLKTVVLVNENSASASEILAAALHDNGMKLVGQKTYGKGVIQNTGELEDGSALKLTIVKYLSPKGNVINKKGVTPDYQVKNDKDGEKGKDKDAQLEKALSLF